MKSYARSLIVVFSLFLSIPIFSDYADTIFSDYAEVKGVIKSLMTEADYSIEINSSEQDYKYWFQSGFKSGLKSSLVVVNMWERHYTPYIPSPYKLQQDLSVLFAMSSQIIYEGFDKPEECWYQEGVSNSLSIVVRLLGQVNIN